MQLNKSTDIAKKEISKLEYRGELNRQQLRD